MNTPRWSLLLLPLLVACVPSQAIKVLEVNKAANLGHTRDAGLPQEAREIAQDNFDKDCVLLLLLADQPLPPDVQLRMQADDARPLSPPRCAEDYPRVRMPRLFFNWQREPGDYDPRFWACLAGEAW